MRILSQFTGRKMGVYKRNSDYNLEFLTTYADQHGSPVSAQKLLPRVHSHTDHTKLSYLHIENTPKWRFHNGQEINDALLDYLVEFDLGQLNVSDYTCVLLARACESQLEPVLSKLLQKWLYPSQYKVRFNDLKSPDIKLYSHNFWTNRKQANEFKTDQFLASCGFSV